MTQTVSVLIAAYDAERWLRESVASVQDQRLPAGWRLEVIVGVDGCATTEVAAKALEGGNLTVVTMAENNGTYVTFNTLMEVAAGDYICRFDADDVMLPGYMARHIESIADVDYSMCWSIYTDADLKPTSHVMAHESFHPEGGECRRGSEGQFVMRRRVWDALGGFRPWRCAADTDFIHRVAAHGFRIGVVEEFLYYRRTHPDSLTVRSETNFKSALRGEYQAFIDEHKDIYGQSPPARRVEPVTASGYAYV